MYRLQFFLQCMFHYIHDCIFCVFLWCHASVSFSVCSGAVPCRAGTGSLGADDPCAPGNRMPDFHQHGTWPVYMF